MIKKYHKDIGFLPCHIAEAQFLIKDLQYRKISFSSHALQSLKDEAEAVKIGQYILQYTLNFQDVFELAIYDGKIEKMGFRISFNNRDIIFILTREKRIVTLWTNAKEDCHYTLNTNKYEKCFCSLLTI